MRNLIRHFVTIATLTGSTLSSAAPLAAQIHEGVGVRIRAPSVFFERFEGIYLGRRGDTVLVGSEDRVPVRIMTSAITEMDVSRGKSRAAGAIAGALWGSGIGLVLGGVMAASVRNDPGYGDLPKGVIVAQMAAGSAEIGAIIGAIVGKRRWTRAQPEILLHAVRVAPRAQGVQFAIRYTR